MRKLMTVEELADYLRLSERTIYRLLKEGYIPGIKVGARWRFNQEVIDWWSNPVEGSKKLRILVIGNTPAVCLVIRETLEGQGHTILTATTIAEGLEYLEGIKFDQVFVDLKLPEIDRVEFLQRLREISPDVPATIIVDYPCTELMMKVIDQGAINIIRKPFDISDIVAAVGYTKRNAPRGLRSNKEETED